MKILRKNYFSANILEAWEGGGGTPEHLKPDAELVEIVDVLKKAQIKHRQNDEFLIWSYWFLMNDKPGKSFHHPGAVTELEIFFDYQKELWTHKDKIPERLDDWIEKYCSQQLVSGHNSHVLLEEGKNDFNQDRTRSIRCARIHDVEKLEELKKWHEVSVKTFEDAKKVKIETVLDFMDNPKWPKEEQNALTVQSQMPALKTVIAELPKASEVSAEQAQKEAEGVTPDNYETIYNKRRNKT